MDRHPMAIAWDKWIASEEGVGCAADSVSAQDPENLLWRAFQAGSAAKEALKEQAEPKSELLDAILRTITDGPPEDDPGKAVYVAAGKFFVAMLQAALAGADYAKAHALGGAAEESPDQ